MFPKIYPINHGSIKQKPPQAGYFPQHQQDSCLSNTGSPSLNTVKQHNQIIATSTFSTATQQHAVIVSVCYFMHDPR